MLRKLLLLSIILLLLAGCEEIIPLDHSDKREITVYALAVSGQQFKAYVSQSRTIANGPNFYYLNYYDFVNETKEYFADSLIERNAVATLTVNGSRNYDLTFHPDSMYYSCNYYPQSGDNLLLEVNAPGMPSVSSQCTIATPVEITDISHYVFYDQAIDNDKREFYLRINDFDVFGADSVSSITFSFHDPAKERNYYRLVVKSVGEFFRMIRNNYCVCAVYTSSDPVFYDRQLTKGYGSWDPYFSDVFDDGLFNGQDYTITVNSRIRSESKPHTVLELQSISPDLYYFLKSMQIYRISTDDAFSTPIGVFSNIDNGWGILGSINYDRHFIYY